MEIIMFGTDGGINDYIDITKNVEFKQSHNASIKWGGA